MSLSTTFYYNNFIDARTVLEQIYSLTSGYMLKQGYLPVTEYFPQFHYTQLFPSLTNKEYEQAQPGAFILDSFPKPITTNKVFNKSINIISNAIKKSGNEVDKDKADKLKSSWLAIQDRFFDYFEDIFGTCDKDINLNVYVSAFGGDTVFFAPIASKNTLHIDLLVRDDKSIAEIAEGFIESYFWKIVKDNQNSWGEQEAIFDFMMKNTKLKKLFPAFNETLKNTRAIKDNANVLKNSQNFLNQIGFKYEEEIKILGNEIYIFDKLPQHYFTPSETKILKFLFDKKNKICSYFDIAGEIWDDPDDFSIWAISRMIYKIRNKLKQNGIDPNKLKTYRGKGFVLES